MHGSTPPKTLGDLIAYFSEASEETPGISREIIATALHDSIKDEAARFPELVSALRGYQERVKDIPKAKSMRTSLKVLCALGMWADHGFGPVRGGNELQLKQDIWFFYETEGNYGPAMNALARYMGASRGSNCAKKGRELTRRIYRNKNENKTFIKS